MTDESVQAIAAHYDETALAGHGRNQRSKADCVLLRKLNNWVKLVQIQSYVYPGDCILDLCCGKGGDIGKYDKRPIGYYVGCDISSESVREAVNRYNHARADFGAILMCGDCFGPNLIPSVPAEIRFNAVGCQFSLHYAFENESRARQMLSNVSKRLNAGGHFYGTCPDANGIVSRMREKNRVDPESISFGNDYFKISIDKPGAFDKGKILKSNPFGHRYMFHLNDSINSCYEWLVPKHTLVTLAAEVGLELQSWMNLHQFFVKYSSQNDYPEYFRLLQKMSIGGNRHGVIPFQQFEVSSLYVAFTFKKAGAVDRNHRPYRRGRQPVDPNEILFI